MTHNSPGVPDRLWVNIAGHGADPSYVLSQVVNPYPGLAEDRTRYVRFADLDKDGDEDYVETNFITNAFPRIFYNRTKDIKYHPFP